LTRQERLGWVATAVGLFAIAAATLTPLPLNEYRAADTPFWCLVCGSLGLIDVVLNVALFLPLGVGLERLGWSVPRLAMASFLVSFGIESLQIITIAGRDASLSDLITNTSGGMLGGFLAHHWRVLVTPSPRVASRLLLAGMMLVLGGFLTTATLLQPDLPAGPWFGIVTPDWPGHAAFGGTVLEARVGNQEISRDPLPAVEYRMALLSGAPILGRFIADRGTPSGSAPIAALTSSDNRSLALLAQRGRDVIVGVRLKASAWRLRSPRIRLSHAIPTSQGDTVVAWGGLDGGQLYAGALVNERWRGRRLALSTSLGWALLLPFGWGLGAEARVINGLWVVALIFPLAYWAVLSRRRSALLWVGILIPIALVSLPEAFGQRVGDWSDWLASGLAITLGMMAANYARMKPSGPE